MAPISVECQTSYGKKEEMKLNIPSLPGISVK